MLGSVDDRSLGKMERRRNCDLNFVALGKVSVCSFLIPLMLGCVSTSSPREAVKETVSKPQYEEPFTGISLQGWARPTGNWLVAGDVVMAADSPETLSIQPGEGVLVNGKEGRTSNLLSTLEHGDIELHVEFLVPKGSNSGVYLQGRYEVQILDSWQVYAPGFGDCGGIYQRYVNGKGFGGVAPRINASLPPGEWQRFDITFRAPRFDDSGRKLENARFVKVIHNGVVIHENIEVTGPTQAASFGDENPWGPLMFQGDHGPVAYRDIVVRHLVIP